MSQDQPFASEFLSLRIAEVELRIAAIHRQGNLAPIVFLHGFGSTKEDYADICFHELFTGRPFVAYDAPGCGMSDCADLSKISIPFLRDVAQAVLGRLGIDRFHLVGHSMGGLTALMLAYQAPQRVISFANIEGNIAPEDCFLSRQIVSHSDQIPERFFDEFVQRTQHSGAYASALYASALRQKVRVGAVRPIFESMVELSDHGQLMQKFLGLPMPKMFMYGDQNSSLSYLDSIQSHGVRLAEVPQCGHFPMYSNPVVMWSQLAEFQSNSEITSRSPISR